MTNGIIPHTRILTWINTGKVHVYYSQDGGNLSTMPTPEDMTSCYTQEEFRRVLAATRVLASYYAK